MRLPAKEQTIAMLILNLCVRSGGVGTETEQPGAGKGGLEFGQGDMATPIHQRPIIKPRPLQRLIVHPESKPANQVQHRP